MSPDAEGGERPEVLERELGGLRDEIGDIVGELDRRRRELFDLRKQASRHPVALAVGGAAAVLLVGASITLAVKRRRGRQRPGYQARQLRAAVRRMIDHPERVGRGEPSPGEQILTAVGVAAATLLVKRALQRAVPEVRPDKASAAAAPAAARRAG